jgi:hypothetical protein
MLFRRNIEPSCSYCRFGANLGNGEIACSKRGIMSADGSCNAFKYEPTKREPEFSRGFKATNVSEEDFIL